MNNIFRIIFALFLLSLFQGCASTVDYLADAAARGEERKRCRAWNNPVEAQKCYQRIERKLKE